MRTLHARSRDIVPRKRTQQMHISVARILDSRATEQGPEDPARQTHVKQRTYQLLELVEDRHTDQSFVMIWRIYLRAGLFRIFREEQDAASRSSWLPEWSASLVNAPALMVRGVFIGTMEQNPHWHSATYWLNDFSMLRCSRLRSTGLARLGQWPQGRRRVSLHRWLVSPASGGSPYRSDLPIAGRIRADSH